MKENKKDDGKNPPQGDSSSTSSNSDPKEAINRENRTDTTKTSKDITEQSIKRVDLITREPISVKSSKFERRGFYVQTTLAVIGILTLIGFVIFSFIQHNDSIHNLELAQRGFDSTNIHTNKALAKTDSSINLTKQIAATQEKFAKIETRAYIIFKTKKVIQFDGEKELKFKYIIENYGKTPAYGLLVKTGFKFSKVGVYATDFNNLKINATPLEGTATLGATQELVIVHASEGKKLHSAMFNDIEQGKLLFFIMGIIYYNDTFGDKHWTRFCLQYQWRDKDFIFYSKYNDGN